MIRKPLVRTMSLGLVAVSASAASPRPVQQSLSIALRPIVLDQRVQAIEVRETFSVAAPSSPGDLFSLPIVTDGVSGVLDDPATLSASDQAGPLALNWHDDPIDPTASRQYRHWRPRRAIIGTVTISYRATPRIITAETKPAALFDMRIEELGVHGSTKILLALPELGWPRRTMFQWHLDAMARGSRAVSSFGEGDTSNLLDRKQLDNAYFMAGPWERYAPGGENGFIVYHLSTPDFDLVGPTKDVGPTYRYANTLFGTKPTAFRVLMRMTDRQQGGGTGGYRSFFFGTVRGSPRSPAGMQYLFTHEMLHRWFGNLSSGPEGLWFVEGATNYYTAILPYRLRNRSLAEVGRQIGKWTTDYYANPKRELSEAAATAEFWTDTDAQLLPYSRGALYIALVDARLRAASGGRRRVDELARRMTTAIEQGNGTEALWLSLVTRALGEVGRRDFADLKAGRMLDLPADLFGPCFRRETGPARRFSPGLQVRTSPDGKHVVQAVSENSPALEAGLMKGDEILDWKALDPEMVGPGATITLHVRRGANLLLTRLSPWTGDLTGFSWHPIASSGQRCGL
jgi:hypothetical protein